ncbi:phage shock protein PspA [Sphingomonas ginkgonis]|uniref:Phage shock protein PspA n=1 Tax=Sphingomonas ginkgonis TaxID=2315330 RepID=A0A3R9WTR3_9SPHN|nr:PspA/IM30 family protein [Sphingomonas ginkgonis]RST31623.1 phage shock protein PspA [Sphingomonas ginkgonis]
MPDLTPIEAKVPERAIRLERIEEPRAETRPATPLAAFFGHPLFSRARDIIAANVGEMLDRAEDPATTIRLMIVEMEEALVEVRASAARSIADMKEMRRTTARLATVEQGWADKAELALDKGRDDLARLALAERQKAADIAASLGTEMLALEQLLKGYEADIARLQAKINEARARQHAIASRLESAMTRARSREIMNSARAADAFARFDLLEKRADLAEGYADAMGMTGPKSLEEEFAELRAAEAIDAELNAMKAALAARRSH